MFPTARKKDSDSVEPIDASSSSTTADNVTQPEPSSATTTTVSASSATQIPYRPSKSFAFPKTKVGERNRSCQHIWFEQFPWLRYDTM